VAACPAAAPGATPAYQTALTGLWVISLAILLGAQDWAEYAGLCGATGIKVDRREQFDAAMARMFAADGPVLLHIEQDPELL
jgi:thiamine pyrophosphate-dependent acetolactate synthase large subunit-like protein